MADPMLREIALRVVCRVIEDAAFIFAEEAPEGSIPLLETWSPEGVALEFTGAHSGVVRMWADRSFARSVAANMLGIDESEPCVAEKSLDALRELLNMITGNLLTALYGDRIALNLGLPAPLAPKQLEADYCDRTALRLVAEWSAVLIAFEVTS